MIDENNRIADLAIEIGQVIISMHDFA